MHVQAVPPVCVTSAIRSRQKPFHTLVRPTRHEITLRTTVPPSHARLHLASKPSIQPHIAATCSPLRPHLHVRNIFCTQSCRSTLKFGRIFLSCSALQPDQSSHAGRCKYDICLPRLPDCHTSAPALRHWPARPPRHTLLARPQLSTRSPGRGGPGAGAQHRASGRIYGQSSLSDVVGGRHATQVTCPRPPPRSAVSLG